MITIRKAKLKDAKEIAKLYLLILDYHAKAIPKFFDLKKKPAKDFEKLVKSKIHSSQDIFLIAEDGEQIVGMLCAGLSKRPPVFKERKIGVLSDVFISSGYRKQGISKRLLQEAIGWFKEKGVKRIEAGVYFDNRVARATWKSQGFKDVRANMVKFIK